MKKHMIAPLLLIAICGSVLAIDARTWESESENIKAINIKDLTESELNEIIQGARPEIAVEFAAKTTLPISVFLKGNLLNLVETDNNLKSAEIVQTFYARCVEQELMLSNNLIDWKPFLEFITGSTSIALSIQDGQPSIILGAETNIRPFE